MAVVQTRKIGVRVSEPTSWPRFRKLGKHAGRTPRKPLNIANWIEICCRTLQILCRWTSLAAARSDCFQRMMVDANTTLQLQVLQRQYFQLVELHQLRWPDDATLKQPDVQGWMFHEMFDAEKLKSPPPDRYQLRVLKMLISKLEKAIDDPEEDV
ncbi:hypothetical protein BDU57DRAFT_160877 [Ampelomyces quisqualis]|uniref:Uncharacterized protein n=1 Tax=Ampelomyces quisqualis TaxID=50730 RepID=A0A6A5QTP7_AMPQU|nr:hypothetical protein BDU57DRAFT_160877 [Ampelomyces quisqualis]